MYTTVPRPEIIDHRPESGEPLPVIIDHSIDTGKWKLRHRKEQLPYDTLKKHRDALLEAEYKYKRTIRDLEKEREELVNTYETAYQENKQLKSILEHGPDAAKLKQLSKDKKEQKGMIEQLQDENKELGERLKRLEKIERLTDPGNDLLEKTWKETLDKIRKKREEEDAIPTQGPFVAGKLFKKKRIAIDDSRLEELDTYDLQLDSIQKETQVLLNKVKQLKSEKEHIDYTLMMGKGSVTRNAVVANAISEKLNRDLNKYAIRLQRLKLKHKSAKQYVREVRTVVVLGDKENDTVYLPSLGRKYLKPESPGEIITFQTKPVNKSPPLVHKTPWSISTKKAAPKDVKNQVPERNNWIPPKQFDKPGTYAKLHQKTAQQIEQNVQEKDSQLNSAESNDLSDSGLTLNNDFRDDMRIQKSKNRIKTSSQGSLIRTTRAQSMRDTWVKNKDTSNDTNGKNAGDIEAIGRGKKAKIANSSSRSEEKNVTRLSARTDKTFPFQKPVHMNNKPTVGDNETYDDVLEYLKKQSNGPATTRGQTQEPKDPVPINFNTDGRYVRERKDLMGNTGLRDRNYVPVKYVM